MTNKTQVASKMAENTGLGDAAVQLADKLGYGVTELWQLYVQAQQAQAIANAISMAFGLIPAVIILGYGFRKREEIATSLTHHSTPQQDDVVFVVLMTAATALCVGLVSAIIGEAIAQGVILKLLAPEYTAAQELIGQINTLT